MPAVKAITITIPEELDKRAAAEAKRRGMSKSELIRRGLEAVLPEAPQPKKLDPEFERLIAERPDLEMWIRLSGFGSDAISVEPRDIDRIVYGI
jgi:hypothetical protein